MQELLFWLSAGGGLVGLSTLGLYLRYRKRRKKQEQNEPPPPPLPPSIPAPEKESQPKLPPSPPQPPKPDPEKERLKNEEKDVNGIIERIVQGVSFSAKRVHVGRRIVGQRALGVEREEVLYPADDVNIRPITGSAEMGNLLVSELQNEDMLLARLAANEALVAAPVEDRIITEDIYEEVWEDRRRILYLLLDVSASMFPESGTSAGYWRPFIWKPLAVRLLRHAINNEAIFLSRKFCGVVHSLCRAVNEEEARNLEKAFLAANPENDTDIPEAIGHAISDFEREREKYEQGEIVIVTDGENNYNFDPPALREKFRSAKLKLHAILLGAQNEALRACADSYQIVEKAGEGKFLLHELVKK